MLKMMGRRKRQREKVVLGREGRYLSL